MKTLIKDFNVWRWAFFSFIVAGLGGVIFRLGFVYPLPDVVNLSNVRHAHSHLTFFGWAVLLPLYFIKVDSIRGYHAAISSRLMNGSLWFSMVFGLLSFPAFWMWGYKLVIIGSAQLPVSAIISGMVMIGWYGFMAGYLITRFKKQDFKPNVWFEGAMVMLFVSSLGAWGVGFAGIFEIGGALFGKALTHFFLSTFVEGWVIIILMGFITKALAVREDDFVVSPAFIIGLISIGAPLTFPYGIPESMVSINLSVSARLGGILIAEGVLIFVYSVIKSKYSMLSLWKWPLGLLVLKALMQIVVSVSPSDLWLSAHAIRIFYLHVILLGALTTGMICYITNSLEIHKNFFYGVLASVGLVLFSLVLLTGFWPVSFSGRWVFYFIAFAAVLPVASVALLWFSIRKSISKE
jgi:hypothetical protein